MVTKALEERTHRPVVTVADAQAQLEASISETAEALKDCELLRELTTGESRTIAAAFRIEHYAAGEPIFRQGEPGTRVYLIRLLDGLPISPVPFGGLTDFGL